MPKRKVNPVEEPLEPVEEAAEAGAEVSALPEEPPQEERPKEMDAPPGEMPGVGNDPSPFEGAAAFQGDSAGEAQEVDASDSVDSSATVSEGGMSIGTQESATAETVPLYGEPYDGQPVGEDAMPPESSPGEEAPPIPERPMSDRQNFFALDFRELDRGLTAEERQAWNSIYASFRGHSALSGKIIGADPLSMNVRNRETGQVEKRTMHCVVVLMYRIPVYIPATEMWTGEARPDFVLRNMMGSTIDFIITKVDREGGYAIASRRQAARAQRYFFAHRPDLCHTGARAKCRMLAVGPRRCLVECYGHDVDLTQRELQISVKETESNPYEGAELRHPVGSRRYAVIAGKYGGGVFCNLPDGTVCMCNYSYQHEDSDFRAGDSVMLVVQRFEREKRQMYGKILSKW